MNLVQAEGLYKDYQAGEHAVPAIRGVNFSISSGSFACFVGPSGSGKTTLLNMIGCLDKPTRGQLTVLGKEVADLDRRQAAAFRGEHIGFVFQDFNLIPVLTARENVAAVTEISRAPMTPEDALAELRALPGIGDATVELLEYSETSWTGEPARQEKIFPAWILAENHPLVRGMSDAVAEVTGSAPRISRWGFSTNGVATMGTYGIPTVGFAPGREELAHTTQEHVRVDDLIVATAVYSLLPEFLSKG